MQKMKCDVLGKPKSVVHLPEFLRCLLYPVCTRQSLLLVYNREIMVPSLTQRRVMREEGASVEGMPP